MAARRSSSVWRMRSCRVSMAMEASESCRAVAEAQNLTYTDPATLL